MNVAIVAPRSVPYPGALERHIGELTRGLARRGVAVELLSHGHDHSITGVLHVDGVVERRFCASRRSPRAPIAPALCEYLRGAADAFDIVHAHCTHPLLTLAAARARPRRLIFSPMAPIERMLRWPHGGATRAAVYVATETLCLSHSDAALLCRALPTATNRVRVVPGGVDMRAIGHANPFPTLGTPVLTVGRLLRHKRIDRVIAAVTALAPDFQLVIVGDGPDRRRLKAYADDLQVSSRVRFVGRVSDADLHRWLRTARVVVTVSQQEAFGFQVLEGVAAGAPVVASDISAHREAADDLPDGAVTFVSPEGSPLEVADAIRAACAGLASAPIRPLPSWAEVVDTTLEVYQELMWRPSTDGALDGRAAPLRPHERPRVAVEG